MHGCIVLSADSQNTVVVGLGVGAKLQQVYPQELADMATCHTMVRSRRGRPGTRDGSRCGAHDSPESEGAQMGASPAGSERKLL